MVDSESGASQMPTSGSLIDRFGRVANDLRVSVTDRCNLRCMYCMPSDGLPWLPKAELLTFEEIERLVALFVELGVKTIRLTGGEPLVRRNLTDLIKRLAKINPKPELTLTTNGVLLAPIAKELADAGLDRVNISLDSLQADRYEKITRRRDLERTLAGMAAAAEAGLTPVKVNCVIMRGTNDDELVDFARMARDTGCVVRFIEYMPLDADGRWSDSDVVSAEEMLDTLGKAGFSPAELDDDEPDPAARYTIEGGEIGIIPSITAPFCSSCNRIRITAEGGLRNCLFALGETNLRDPLRAGADDDELESLVRQAVWAKWSGHRIGKDDFVRPDKSMSQIGG